MTTYYASINPDGIVDQVIVADADFIATQPGTWVETFMDDPGKKYAGIGDGWDGLAFVAQPFASSRWDAVQRGWITPPGLGTVNNAPPIITADGQDFVLVYLVSSPNTQETVLLNGEALIVNTDGRGYGEFELSSDASGLIRVSWGGFTLEVAVI